MADAEKVLRVSQLDVLELDEELQHGFESKIMAIFQPLPSFAFFLRLKPELKAATRALIWLLSVDKTGNTFGQEMLALGYLEENNLDNNLRPITVSSKYSLLLIVILRWIEERLEDILEYILPRMQLFYTEKLKDVINSILKFARCVNFCLFLLYGVYPSLKERLLRLQMVPLASQRLRQPDYHYMNREIIWYGFSELLFFLLPQINFFVVRNYIRKRFTSVTTSSTGASVVSSPELLSPSSCSYCKRVPTLPQVASSCGHVYCYYCIAANLKADKNYPCEKCGDIVNNFDHALYR